MTLRLATLVLAAAIPAAVSAQESAGVPKGLYGSLGYAQTAGGDAELKATQGRLGARINRYVGVEAEVAGGVNRHPGSRGLQRDVELERQGAAYGVAYAPISPKADFFARVGYGDSRSKASTSGARSEASWNYGAGAQYFPNRRNGVRADFTRQDFRDRKVKANVFSVGFVQRF